MSITHSVHSADLKFELDDRKIDLINAKFGIDHHRMIEQDVGFGIRQIVDIALKALSPGVNDTSTGVTCIHFLGDIIGNLARKEFPAKIRSNDDEPRVITVAPSFQNYVQTAFDQIRISGEGNVAIFQQLSTVIAYIAKSTDDKAQLRILKKQLKLVEEFADKTLKTSYEKQILRDKLKQAYTAFG